MARTGGAPMSVYNGGADKQRAASALIGDM